MKKFLSMLLAVSMLVTLAVCFVGCGEKEETIKVGMLGPYTGGTAQYGIAVRNGAMLYFDKVNAAGGINGKKIEVVYYDNKGSDEEAVSLFNRLVSKNISAFLGDVLTSNTIAVVGEAYPINMPMVTPSATDPAVTVNPDTGAVYTNVFRTCFIDTFQGSKMADYVADVFGAKKVAVIYTSGSDYSEGITKAFVERCDEIGLTVVAKEAFSESDVDFNAQLTNIKNANPDVVYCPNYYEKSGLIVTQARALGLDVKFCGGDGWGEISKYASAKDLEGCVYTSSYASGSSDAVNAFEAEYIENYGKETLNMFAATSYDAAMVIVNALTVVDNMGLEVGSDEYKQAVIDAIRNNSADLACVTSNGYSFDEYNNPIKSAFIIKCANGKEVLDRVY